MKTTSLICGLAMVAVAVLGCGSSGGKGNTKDGGKDATSDVVTQPDVAADAPAEVSDEAPAGDAASDAGTDAAAEASVDADAAADVGGDGGVDGPVEAASPFDAGLGCLPPPDTQTPLVPATENIPAQGLALWVRADRGIYMTPGAGAVCAWADQSGHGRILTNAGERPLWMPGTVGGKEGVHFGTAAAAMFTAGAIDIPAASGRTFVAVVASVSTTKRFQPVQQGKAGTPGTYLGIDTNTFNSAGSREGVYVTNNAYDSALATSTAARVHVFTMSTMAAGTAVLPSIDYRVDGVVQTVTRTGGGLGNGNIESIATVDFTAVGSPGGDAIVAEVLIYNHPLGPTERTALQAALLTRYGLPLPAAGL